MTELPEIERQVIAAADRYREVAALHDVTGLPDSGRHAAAKAVGRAVDLLSFVLRRGVEAGIGVERLSELTGLDREPVRELLERRPEPGLVSSPDVTRAAASSDAVLRLQALLAAVLADVEDERWSPAAADLDELHDRIESAWRAWRQGLRGPTE